MKVYNCIRETETSFGYIIGFAAYSSIRGTAPTFSKYSLIIKATRNGYSLNVWLR